MLVRHTCFRHARRCFPSQVPLNGGRQFFVPTLRVTSGTFGSDVTSIVRTITCVTDQGARSHMESEAGRRITEAQLEEDARGMRALVQQGHLPWDAPIRVAKAILGLPPTRCFICTGFYILKAGATETDGPPGAVALGEALESLGWEVMYVTDLYSAPVVKATAGSEAKVLEFPIDSDALSEDFAQRLLRDHEPGLLISVERCGLGRDGTYRNMRGIDFSDYNAKLDYLFRLSRVPSIGIADGGNEIGCGALVASGAIPGADPKLTAPPCVTTCDSLLVGASSNWAAYGLCAALSFLSQRNLLPSPGKGSELVDRSVSAGAVDGITHAAERSVDGRSLGETCPCLERLHAVLREACNADR